MHILVNGTQAARGAAALTGEAAGSLQQVVPESVGSLTPNFLRPWLNFPQRLVEALAEVAEAVPFSLLHRAHPVPGGLVDVVLDRRPDPGTQLIRMEGVQ